MCACFFIMFAFFDYFCCIVFFTKKRKTHTHERSMHRIAPIDKNGKPDIAKTKINNEIDDLYTEYDEEIR